MRQQLHEQISINYLITAKRVSINNLDNSMIVEIHCRKPSVLQHEMWEFTFESTQSILLFKKRLQIN